jgi:hypothetical protein
MDRLATAEAISAYLFEIATKHMRLSNIADLADCSDRVGRALVAIRPELETH